MNDVELTDADNFDHNVADSLSVDLLCCRLMGLPSMTRILTECMTSYAVSLQNDLFCCVLTLISAKHLLSSPTHVFALRCLPDMKIGIEFGNPMIYNDMVCYIIRDYCVVNAFLIIY